MNKSLKSLTRTLLATTCLTVAANAAIVSEPPDFSNSIAAPTVLDPSATGVVGQLNPFQDQDFFEFTGLNAGDTFTLAYDSTSGFLTFAAYDPANTGSPLDSQTLASTGSFTGVVPTGGAITVGVTNVEGSNYTVDLAIGAPEPGTFGVAGLALAGAMALRRKQKKD